MTNLLNFQRKNQNTSSECRFKHTPGGIDVNINSVAMARTLLLKHAPVRYRPIVALLRSALGHRVMIAADNPEWMATHEALKPGFLPLHLIQNVVPVMWSVASATVADIAAQSSAAPERSAWIEVAFEKRMRTTLARIMCQSAFGHVLSTQDAERLDDLIDLLTQPIERGGRAAANRILGAVFRRVNLSEHQPVFIPAPQRKAAKALCAWIGETIDDARARHVPAPMLDNLERRFANLSPARRRHHMSAECAMLFVAGIETTAAALTFAMVEISGNPEILSGVLRDSRKDIDGKRIEPQPNPTEMFPYIHRVVQETLRRHTIVPTILREAAADCKIEAAATRQGGAAVLTIPRRAVLRFLPIQGHLRARVWPNPKNFDPGRFARSLTAEQKKNYNPFGLGPQSCLGRLMAVQECVIILAAVFRGLDVKPQPIHEPIQTQRNALFTNRPVGVSVIMRAI